jgi:hypothetical protein
MYFQLTSSAVALLLYLPSMPFCVFLTAIRYVLVIVPRETFYRRQAGATIPLPTQMAFLMSCLASDLRTILLCVFFLALAAYAFSSLFSVHPHFDVPCSITCPELESLP